MKSLVLENLRGYSDKDLHQLLAEVNAEIHHRIDRDEIDEELLTLLTNWLRIIAARANANGFTLGLSGGIDSSVTAALCERAIPAGNRYFYLPCESPERDREDAYLVAGVLNLELQTVDIYPMYVTFCEAIDESPHQQPTPLHLMNLKAMVRAVFLSTVANEYGLLIAGTGNRSEMEHTGYFTKRGDGASDNAVLGHLFKRQVRVVARLLGIPEEIVTRPPTPGLRFHPDGKPVTDEEELGMEYEEVELATRLFIEFGDDLEALSKAVESRYSERADRILTVCKRLGIRSWR
ncbi:MAG: NAD(+) synthase, partial [Anaerolineae bacterium]